MILLGNCLDRMKELPDNSVDSIVTDPPYGLSFMGKKWDYDVPSQEIWEECLRVLKPGGYLLSFAGTRTQHRMAVRIEDAGFEIRDMIAWIYGSGFPKSLNIGKVTNKFLKTGNASWNGTGDSSNGALGYSKLQHKQDYRPEDYSNRHQNKDEITEEKAKQWEGWGTALKPALEPITVARKPIEGTVANNVLKWGVGGLNIDASRVGTSQDDKDMLDAKSSKNPTGVKSGFGGGIASPSHSLGRFPANLLHDGSDEVVELFPNTKSTPRTTCDRRTNSNHEYGFKTDAYSPHNDSGSAARYFKSFPEEIEEVKFVGDSNKCTFFLTENSVFYCAKASKSERNMGCEGLEVKQTTGGGGMNNTEDDVCGKYGSIKSAGHNHHPTVKPLALMEYLIKLVTPKGGVVLDPFAGSGSTLVAAKRLGYDFIGIEMTEEYIPIIEARLASVVQGRLDV